MFKFIIVVFAALLAIVAAKPGYVAPALAYSGAAYPYSAYSAAPVVSAYSAPAIAAYSAPYAAAYSPYVAGYGAYGYY